MNHGYILPTPVEILREIAGCLNVKNNNKKLDDKLTAPLIHPELFKSLSYSVLYEPISKNGSKRFAEFITISFNSFITAYCHGVVGHIRCIDANRSKALILLNKQFFSVQLIQILNEFINEFAANLKLDSLLRDDSAFDVAWRWCDVNIPNWGHFEKVAKEQKDQIRNWRNGTHLPTMMNIKNLCEGANRPAFPILLTARFIDSLKRKVWGGKLISEVTGPNLGHEQTVRTSSRCPRLDAYNTGVAALQNILTRPGKTIDDLDKASRHLQSFINLNGRSMPIKGRGVIAWLEGRFLVQSGYLESAIKSYEYAFNSLLFCGGRYLEGLISEALVSISINPNPDKVLLKKLKTAQILFGFDIQSAGLNTSNKQQRFEDTVENWEIEMWKKGFSNIFAPEYLFPHVDYKFDAKVGPLLLNQDSEIKLDVRNPDRKIKVGAAWTRKMPQLNYFILMGRFEEAKALIDSGANVNVTSEVGDTPMLIALGHLDLLEFPPVSLDKRFYDLIISQPITNKVINTRTEKKKLLPLIQAVRTGKLEIVQDVLDRGADVFKRGLADNQTALNDVIKIIGTYKDPEGYKRVLRQHPNTPELFDAFRRYSAGSFGITLKEVEQNFTALKQEAFAEQFLDSVVSAQVSSLHANTSLDELRKIAITLIEKGADPNAEHNSPVKGYTPMMLAAEFNEADLFKMMWNKGGNPNKTYNDPNTHKPQNCWQIATYFGSSSILSLRE